MHPIDLPLGERVFYSSDVTRAAGITLRQLQWWDERKLISPRMEEHRRLYSSQQVLEIAAVAALRRKGLSLQKIRKVVRALRRELRGQAARAWRRKSKLYVGTDGSSVYVDDRPKSFLVRLADVSRPVYVVCLSDQVTAIMCDDAPRRYRTTQLDLFGSSTRAAGEGNRPARGRGAAARNRA